MIDPDTFNNIEHIAARIRYLETAMYRGIGLDLNIRNQRDLEFEKVKIIILQSENFTQFLFDNLKNLRRYES